MSEKVQPRRTRSLILVFNVITFWLLPFDWIVKSWALYFCLKWKLTEKLWACCLNYCCVKEESRDLCSVRWCSAEWTIERMPGTDVEDYNVVQIINLIVWRGCCSNCWKRFPIGSSSSSQPRRLKVRIIASYGLLSPNFWMLSWSCDDIASWSESDCPKRMDQHCATPREHVCVICWNIIGITCMEKLMSYVYRLLNELGTINNELYNCWWGHKVREVAVSYVRATHFVTAILQREQHPTKSNLAHTKIYKSMACFNTLEW